MTQLEDLSNEVFLEILDYLDATDDFLRMRIQSPKVTEF
jgi:hypothetical protein